MAQYAILHTATRLIRRLTTEASSPVLADETIVDTSASPLDLAGGPYVLGADNVTLTAATAAQIAAGDLEAISAQRAQAIWAAIDDILTNGTNQNLVQKLKAYLQALKAARS